MSRVINIGEFFTVKNSIPSALESMYSKNANDTFAQGIITVGGTSGSTGPIGFVPLFPPAVNGQYVLFDVSGTALYYVQSSDSMSFTLSTGVNFDVPTGTSISIYGVSGSTGSSGRIREASVLFAESGSSIISMDHQTISTGMYFISSNGPVITFGPSIITSMSSFSTGSVVYVADTLTSNIGFSTAQVSTGHGGPLDFHSVIRAHNQRQFGNHPRI